MRKDFKIIFSLINNNSKVLDLGCGSGDLLELLAKKKTIVAKGIEIHPKKASESIAKGISVYEGDMFEVLPNYKTKSYDYVILSQTLSEVSDPKVILSESLRVGKKVIVSFANFGYISNRLSILLKGRIAQKTLYDYCWYEKKYFHPFSILEFERYCLQNDIRIIKKILIFGPVLLKHYPNLLARHAVFLLEG
ncbi:Methionine biosynthesis protein MetW [Desulfurella amilsii]|uniref:Methionine biosynthesis protein MetW n=1 Tax=Desulfurella amilsii TaxID=1562698 RepID=A0A1X4XUA3_9BACT|nr:methionine biosynthesis protein MetW [Desulfurella amilsii]OSS41115.1 Methionine biosynthesis protein MetW [Desulfurella amilsii]